MKQITTISELQDRIRELRKTGRSIGFVPTMGALHEGHLSLVEQCLKKGDLCVTSIYVNPTQFNDKNDLRNYPRDPDRDCSMLQKAGCAIAFLPSDEEMYPEPDTREFSFGEMGNVMEGKHRPGHFNGVAQIVTRLFDAVGADRAYFGMKDFQQLAIIRKLVADLNYPIEIIGCPIVRETDGLAMSSRNQLLGNEYRREAPLIYHCLKEVRSRIKNSSVPEIKAYVENTFKNHPLLQLEYFEIVESDSLHPITNITSKKRLSACIAVFAGNVRLIDNVEIIL